MTTHVENSMEQARKSGSTSVSPPVQSRMRQKTDTSQSDRSYQPKNSTPPRSNTHGTATCATQKGRRITSSSPPPSLSSLSTLPSLSSSSSPLFSFSGSAPTLSSSLLPSSRVCLHLILLLHPLLLALPLHLFLPLLPSLSLLLLLLLLHLHLHLHLILLIR